MNTALIAVAFVVLAGSIVLTGRAFSASLGLLLPEMRAIRKAHEAWCGLGVGDREDRLRALEDAVEMLPQRWDQIRKEAERLDGRARHAVRRVAAELEERGLADDTIDGLAGELRLVDGGGGAQEELPAMPQSVAEPPPPPTDWRAAARAQLAHKMI